MRRNFCFCVLMGLMLLGFSSTVVSQFGDPVPRHPKEMDGPVNVVTGGLVFSETDIAVPGRGLGIEFTRYFNSYRTSQRNGPSYMGYKWSHSYQWDIRYSQINGGIDGTAVITGSASKQFFRQKRLRPESGVRATLERVRSGENWTYTYTTRGGIRYKFEHYHNDAALPTNVRFLTNVLTEISEPNGNRLKLHYEDPPETPRQYWHKPRLVAVEDTQGRILKFYYGVRIDNVDYPRLISKIEFGLGTPQALTTVYQTVNYSYYNLRRSGNNWPYVLMTSVTHQLGSGDPRGAALTTQYEYHGDRRLAAVVSPLGYRTEFSMPLHYRGWGHVRVRDVPPDDSTDGDVLYQRGYLYRRDRPGNYYQYRMYAGTRDPDNLSSRKHDYIYHSRFGQVFRMHLNLNNSRIQYPSLDWSNYSGNVIMTAFYDSANNKKYWRYKIYYAGSNLNHNRQMGNPTKWEQVEKIPNVYSRYTVHRKWEADYETTYNRPIWQIDSMGHKTTFSYDTKGNLTEQRSKANTGTQPHAVDHDIVTTHAYDAYGNRIKTTFMPGTTQEKVVETVYDSTHHTYPIEVKTTVTVDGAAHTIKTKSEWDVNRGLKTADIDAQGRRTEYAYWKDRKLKYTKRVADNLYTIPTYDKNGNVTQTQVRKTNWQTGTLIAQAKTEYDAMGRAVKAHSFKDNWTTPYSTTETTYDVFGDVSQTKDPRGLITNYTRDRFGNVTKQTLPDGDWVETRYNWLNQVTKAWTSQNGSETSPAVSYTYDKFNRLSQVSYKTGESVSYTYDLGDNTLTQTTNDGAQTYTYTYTHDQLNRVMTRIDSLLGYKTFYEYDDASMRKRMHIQPSAGGTDHYDVSYTYDEANRLLSVKDALAAKTASYAYFDIGALKTTTNPNGVTAHRTLDTLNRLDTLNYKKDTTTVLSSLDYTYDVKSNVTQLVRNDTGAGGSSKTFSFGYDKLSRLTSANYGNETVSYTYDKSGNRLTQVSSVDGTTTYTIAANSNQLNSRSLVPEDSDFATMSYTYDAEGKLTQRSEGTDSDAFSYGFGSQLKQIQKTRAGAVTQTLTYAYDGSGQRVKVTDSGGTRYFLYDGMMPVLELDSNKKVTASYLYGADGVVYRRKPVAAAHWHFDEGTGTVAHDVDGRNNGTLGGGTATKTPSWNTEGGGSLLFDGSNDLVKVPDSDALDLVGNKLTLSCWVKRSAASSGNLVKKANASNGYRLWITATGALQFEVLIGGTTKSVTSATTIPLNTWKHVSARYDGSELRVFIGGTIEAATTAATGSLVATTEALWLGYYDGTSHHLNGYLDDVSIYDSALSDSAITKLADNEHGRYEYHHTNALGSNIIITDDDQNVIVRYEYDVFGAIRSEVGTSDNPRKFTGKEYESDVKLYYYGARYYDPYIGRFTQRDPIGDGLNWYIYAANNPLKFIDPTGLEIVWENGRIYDRKSWIEKVRNYLHRWASKFTGPADPSNVPAPSGPPMPGGTVVGDPDVPEFDPKAHAVKAVIDVLFDFVSPSQEAQLGSDRGLKDEIDKRGGYGKLGEKGRGRNVRHLEGGKDHAEAFFRHLAGDREIEPLRHKRTGQIYGQRGTDPDGNVITYRPVSSHDGPPTVDAKQDGRQIELKFIR